jgi:hypothetical protein
MLVPDRTPRIAYLVVAGAVLSGGMCVGLWMARESIESQLVRQYVEKLASLPTAAAIRTLESLPEEEAWVLEVWCEALGDPRREVRMSAAKRVERTCARWCDLPPAEASPRLTRLAACLARKAPHLPPEQRAWLRRMAQRLLETPPRGATPDAAALIAHCQAILLLPDEPAADEPLVAPVPQAARADLPVMQPNAVQLDTTAPAETAIVPRPEEGVSPSLRSRPVGGAPSMAGEAARTAEGAASSTPALAEPRPLVDATARPLQPLSTGQGAQIPSRVPQQR